MNNELVLRLIALVQKNGDKVVLADPTTGKGVVVMDLDSYERLNAAFDEVQAVSAPAAPAPSLSESLAYEQVARTTRFAEENRSAFAEETMFVSAGPAPHRPQESQNLTNNREIQAISSPPLRRGPGRPRRQTSDFEAGSATADLADLTQDDLLDKINRDIGDWKTAKERHRIAELKSVARKNNRVTEPEALEEEEKFYLEPIE
jgi:hypothetical protein